MYFKQNLTFIYKYATIQRRVGALPPSYRASADCVYRPPILCDGCHAVV